MLRQSGQRPGRIAVATALVIARVVPALNSLSQQLPTCLTSPSGCVCTPAKVRFVIGLNNNKLIITNMKRKLRREIETEYNRNKKKLIIMIITVIITVTT